MTNIKKYLIVLAIGLIIFLVYLPTLNRHWQMFDEKEIYQNESLYPTPVYFSELFEIIPAFVINSNIDSQNLMFSNIINIRSNLVGTSMNVVLAYLFKKNPFNYHILSLCIHILNSVLVWFIFQIILKNFILPTVLTLIWALHPANIESVVMCTNWNCILADSFLFGFFIYNLKKIQNKTFQNSLTVSILLALLLFCCILFFEYSYIFPFIIFFISFAFIKRHSTLLKSFSTSLSLTRPYFGGFILFLFYYFIRNIFSITQHSTTYQLIDLSFERVFWLSPQILFHFLKLFFYPHALSNFQSNLVTIADSLLSPYAVFTFLVFIILLLVPLIFSSEPFFFLIYAFIFSAFPFLHILTPTYCIFAERYCYMPFFVLIFIFANFFPSKNPGKSLGLLLLIISLVLLSTRTIYRLNDWKNSFTLYSSAIKVQKNKLYKGLEYSTLGYYLQSVGKNKEARKYMLTSLRKLNSAAAKLKSNQKKIRLVPKTLKVYGLDTDRLLLKAAFRISYIKLDYLNEPAKKILDFYEPYIKSTIDFAGSSDLDLYAKLLLKNNNPRKALQVLEFAKERYPYSPTIIFSLGNLYIKLNLLDNAEKNFLESFHYYPNYKKTLISLIKLYELKKDQANIAKYEYLLGLRNHSQEAYQKALQIYLSLNKLKEAKKVLDKLLFINKKNPVTLLLLSKYYLLSNQKDKVLETLDEAYQTASKLYIYGQLDVHIYESILLSLISFNINRGNYNEVKNYILELEHMPNIFQGSKLYIQAVKKKFSL